VKPLEREGKKELTTRTRREEKGRSSEENKIAFSCST
jgi:hypothetical protein